MPSFDSSVLLFREVGKGIQLGTGRTWVFQRAKEGLLCTYNPFTSEYWRGLGGVLFLSLWGRWLTLIYKVFESSISPFLCSEMDCEFRLDLCSKGHRKESDKSRSRKDDDSLAEASHSKKTVKKAGNGVIPKLV